MGSYDTQSGPGGAPLAVAAFTALGVSAVIVSTAQPDESSLGAPGYWAWLLTGLQVIALWSAGRKLWWGWLLGGTVQLPWIVYAVMTAQIGFIPGCLVSAAVQIHSYLRNHPTQRPMEVST